LMISGLLGQFRSQLTRSMLSGAHNEEGSASMWKALNYFIVHSGLKVSVLNVFLKSYHRKQRTHFIAYLHICIRSKPFPWRDSNHTLFHNALVNLLPTGYEDE
uniref:Uncharacterized protein n=1 Tax=Rhinolophus ferrumequinum TaxID=59479 RepID=A0A671E3P0_RHIFE